MEVTDGTCLVEKDEVFKFTTLSKLTFGEVYRDAHKLHIRWDDADTTTGRTEELVTTAISKTKLFLTNRPIYIGSLIRSKNDRVGFVTHTKHRINGVVEKLGADGKVQKYVVPGVSEEQLEKPIPYEIGSSIVYQGWVGKVTNVELKTKWEFSKPGVSASVNIPLETLNQRKFTLGQTVQKYPEDLKYQSAYQSKSWNWLGLRKWHDGPATLSDVEVKSISVVWIEPIGPLLEKPQVKIETPEELKLVQPFHFCKDDWSYFKRGERFFTTWTSEMASKTLSYEDWQAQTCLQATNIILTGSASSPKRLKEEPLFSIGEKVALKCKYKNHREGI